MNKARQGQSFLDVTLQQSGLFEQIIADALLNDMSLTEDLTIGTEVNVTKVSQDSVLQFKNRRPATAINNMPDTAGNRGIGYMRIGSTFKVS